MAVMPDELTDEERRAIYGALRRQERRFTHDRAKLREKFGAGADTNLLDHKLTVIRAAADKVRL